MIINNYQIDYLTIYILTIIWSYSTITLLKLNYNSFDENTLILITNLIVNPNNKISKLFFEWNKLSN